jgi:hypothetical protein
VRNSAVRLSSAAGLLSPACVAAASVSALALPALAQGNNKNNRGRILDALYLLAALGPPVYVVLLITSVVAVTFGRPVIDQAQYQQFVRRLGTKAKR